VTGLAQTIFGISAFALAVAPLAAHELIARGQVELLSEADRRAATKAEQETLDRDETIRNFEWKGPDGASGLIIISAQFPDFYGMGRCRNFVHLIRHPKDGGVNPTFEGVVCRGWNGKWSVEPK
jgi:surface antigen